MRRDDHVGVARTADSSVIGSDGNTSSAAPPTLPESSASLSAASSISPPRATFRTRTPSRIFANASASRKPSVSGVFGQVDRDEVGLRVDVLDAVGLLDPELAVALGADERVEREHAHAEAPRALGDELADAPEAEDAERLLVQLDAGELRALPACRAVSETYACGMLRASASSSAIVCSAAVTTFDSGALATTIPRLVAASTSTLSTPTPARPITRRLIGPLDQLGGHLRGGADQDAVVVADPLGELLVGPVDAEIDIEVLAQQRHAGVADLLLDEHLQRPCRRSVSAVVAALIAESSRRPSRCTRSAPARRRSRPPGTSRSRSWLRPSLR